MENGRVEEWENERIRIRIVFGGKMENFCVLLPTATGDCLLLSAFYSLHFALYASRFALSALLFALRALLFALCALRSSSFK